MKAFRHLSATAISLLILGLVWGGAYMARRGFTSVGREQIERLFTARGFPVNMKKITLDPVHGMRAEDITFFGPDKDSKAVVTLDSMSLDMNYRSLSSLDMRLEGWQVHNGSLSVPLEDGPLEVRKLRADAVSGGKGVALKTVSGKIGGVRVSLGIEGGDLLEFIRHPESVRALAPEVDWAVAWQWLREFESVKNLKGAGLHLEIALRPNPAAPGSWDLTAEVGGGPFLYRNWRVDSIAGTLSVKSGQGVLENFVVSNESGQFRINAFRKTADSAWDFHADSTLNLIHALRSIRRSNIPDSLRESAQRVVLEGYWNGTRGKEVFHAAGRFEMEPFVFEDAPLERLSADFLTNGRMVRLREFECDDAQGSVVGSGEWEPGRLNFDLEGRKADGFIRFLPGAAQLAGPLALLRRAHGGTLPGLKFSGLADTNHETLDASLRPAVEDPFLSVLASGSLDSLKWKLEK